MTNARLQRQWAYSTKRFKEFRRDYKKGRITCRFKLAPTKPTKSDGSLEMRGTRFNSMKTS